MCSFGPQWYSNDWRNKQMIIIHEIVCIIHHVKINYPFQTGTPDIYHVVDRVLWHPTSLHHAHIFGICICITICVQWLEIITCDILIKWIVIVTCDTLIQWLRIVTYYFHAWAFKIVACGLLGYCRPMSECWYYICPLLTHLRCAALWHCIRQHKTCYPNTVSVLCVGEYHAHVSMRLLVPLLIIVMMFTYPVVHSCPMWLWTRGLGI